MKEIIERLSKIEHGFKEVEVEARHIFQSNSSRNVFEIANEFFENEIYQTRMLAVFLWGYIASKDHTALNILRTKAGCDHNWRVQEILAKSFDYFCSDIGYEEAMPVITDWLHDSNPNVCRAVTEGLRIWTNRPYFQTNPKIAIELISQHKTSESEYLRKSVGNSLRDIAKKNRILVENEISTWDLSDKRNLFTYK